jgi:hypothetical protein
MIWETQAGVQYLAHETGGFAIINNNDLGSGIDRIMNDSTGYYLIGYRPSDTTFGKANGRAPYHKIKLLAKRPDLQVRSRKGFYGIPDQDRQKSIPRTMEQQVVAALESPFAANGVRLNLTTLFVNGAKGSLIRLLLHIDAHDLTFSTAADGWRQASINVMASNYGDNGLIADYLSRSETIRARGRTFANILHNGLIYDLYIPVKKPGDYQVRAAVRDSATERIGSAFQFIGVPDLKKEQLVLSGIMLSSPGVDLDSILGVPAAGESLGNDEAVRAHATPAVRRFASGMLLDYRYAVYNARSPRQGGLPELTAQVRVFRDGQLVNSREEPAIDTDKLQFDAKRLSAKGRLRLGSELVPGQYVLQIVIADPQAKGQSAPASQWIDFEVVK